MKKFLKIILLAVLSVVCIAMAVGCAPEDGGTPEKGLLYKKINGVYTIYDYVHDDRTDTTLDIGEELAADVTDVRIKKGAFSGNDNFKEIIVPATVTAIDEGAFAGMKALEKITLPFVGGKVDAVNNARTFGYIFGTEEYDGGSLITVTYNDTATENRFMPTTLDTVVINAGEDYKVPMHAFNGCVNLTQIQLNGDVVEIGDYAFNGCKNLSEISVPTTVTKIGKSAFANCTALNETILDGATALNEIGESAFENAKLGSVVFNADAIIGNKAFRGSSVKEVTVKGEVQIGASAFANCVKLEKVLVDSVSNGKIRQFAFQGAIKLNQFGATVGTIDLSGFTTVENLAFADIFEDATKITVAGLSEQVKNSVFGW